MKEMTEKYAHIRRPELVKIIILTRLDVPIIILIGFSKRIDEERVRRIGINRLLMKPVIKSEMAKMVRKVLDESKDKS